MYTTGAYQGASEMPQMSPVTMVIYIALLVLELVSMWKLFVKAGRPGWASIVPIYNVIVMLDIAKKPWWYLLLMLIPFVNFVIAIMVTVAFVKAYGKDTGFAVLTIFFAPIMYPILAFGDSKYQG